MNTRVFTPGSYACFHETVVAHMEKNIGSLSQIGFESYKLAQQSHASHPLSSYHKTESLKIVIVGEKDAEASRKGARIPPCPSLSQNGLAMSSLSCNTNPLKVVSTSVVGQSVKRLGPSISVLY